MRNGHAEIRHKGASSAAVGVAGAVIGAGVAIAATKVLSDKKTRDKIKGTFASVKGQFLDRVEGRKSDSKELKKLGKKHAAEVKDKVASPVSN